LGDGPQGVIWVARPRPGADETAARLSAAGLSPLVAPMIGLEAVAGAPPDGPFSALVLTSAAPLEFLGSRLDPYRGLPVFAVGERTAERARRAGFCVAATGEGDSADLADLILRLAPEGRLLHPCAESPAGDLPARLGSRLAVWPVYRTLERDAPEGEKAFLDHRIDALVVHSPSIGRAAARFLRRTGARLPGVFALSEACAAPFGQDVATEIHIAPFPREAVLISLLCETLGPPAPQPPSPGRFKGTGSTP
jgi:uroporphyrinogen-III synthase